MADDGQHRASREAREEAGDAPAGANGETSRLTGAQPPFGSRPSLVPEPRVLAAPDGPGTESPPKAVSTDSLRQVSDDSAGYGPASHWPEDHGPADYGVADYAPARHESAGYEPATYGAESYVTEKYVTENYEPESYGPTGYGVGDYVPAGYGPQEPGSDAHVPDGYRSDGYVSASYGLEDYGLDGYGPDGHGPGSSEPESPDDDEPLSHARTGAPVSLPGDDHADGRADHYGPPDPYGQAEAYSSPDPRGDRDLYGDRDLFGDRDLYGDRDSFGDRDPGGWPDPPARSPEPGKLGRHGQSGENPPRSRGSQAGLFAGAHSQSAASGHGRETVAQPPGPAPDASWPRVGPLNDAPSYSTLPQDMTSNGWTGRTGEPSSDAAGMYREASGPVDRAAAAAAARSWSPPAADVAEHLTPELLLPGRRRAPTPGWRRMIYQATGGLLRVPLSAAELRRQDMISRARAPVAGGHHRVAIMSLKGGVGKTTTTVGLGSILASLRGDRVIAVDANPDRGTLSDKVTLETAATIRDLLNESAQIRRYADVRTFTSQAASRLEILASDRDPTVSVAFSEADYRSVCGVLEHYYSICLTDCGTGLMHSAMAGVLRMADQIVLVSTPSVDGARSASATFDWLAAHGYGDLVRNAVMVLCAVRPRSRSSVDLDRLEEYFAARCRAVTRIPYDAHLEEGAEVELDLLSRATADAYLALAALVGDGLARPKGQAPREPGTA